MSDLRQIKGVHELVVVEGPDARRFLNDLLSQELETIRPDVAVRSFLLAPQGKLRALLWVFGSAERIGMIADAGVGEQVADDLAHYKIRVKATINRPVPVTTVVGGLPERAVAAPLGDVVRGFVEGDVDAPAMTMEEWTALRIDAGEPVMGVDVDEKTIPQESGLVGQAVSFSKGCYLGQELVARIDSRGHVNRGLRRLHLESRVEAPAEVEADGSVVGTMTSISPALDGAGYAALAMLKASVQPGASVTLAGIPARVD
jgi:folate-binding protein YgfZ